MLFTPTSPFKRMDGPVQQDFKLIRDDSGEFRVYRDSAGNAYESVTSFIGRTDPEGKVALQAWRDAVGEAEADRIGKAAAEKGTAVHLACEQYIAGDEAYKGISMFYRRDFNAMRKALDANMTSVFASEHIMFSNKLKLAGTADLICEWNGELSVADFKTSGRIKYRDEISGYFMQMATYSVMLYERYGLQAKNGVIIMSVDGDPNATVFVEPLKPWISKVVKLRRELPMR